MNKWVCSVCGYIHDGDTPPDKCPKCGAPKEKFAKLEDEKVNLIERARFTNMLHMEMAAAMNRVIEIADKGIADNLDPGCLNLFKLAKQQANIIQQSVKAEIQGHVSKGKWG